MSWPLNHVLAAALIAGSTFAVGTTAGSGEAEARRGGFRSGPRVVRVYRPVYVHRPVRRFYRPVPIYRPVVVAGVGPCHWLRVRALRTSSPYWWRRWEACRLGY
jgi:hypothetical protein